MLLMLLDGFTRDGAGGIIQGVSPCDELGFNGWDRAAFHGVIVLMVVVLDLCEDQCGETDGCQDRLCACKG